MLNAHAQHAADLMVVLEESAAMLPKGDVDRAHLQRTARAPRSARKRRPNSANGFSSLLAMQPTVQNRAGIAAFVGNNPHIAGRNLHATLLPPRVVVNYRKPNKRKTAGGASNEQHFGNSNTA